MDERPSMQAIIISLTPLFCRSVNTFNQKLAPSLFETYRPSIEPNDRIDFIQAAVTPGFKLSSTLSVIELIVSADTDVPTVSSSQLLMSRVLVPRAYRPIIRSAIPSDSMVSLFLTNWVRTRHHGLSVL